MRHLNFNVLNKLFFSAALLCLIMFTAGCGDDEASCSKLQQQGIEASLDALAAVSNEDCEGIEAAFATTIQILKKGKSCSWVKDLMEDYEVDTIAELEAEFILQRDEYLDGAGCNDAPARQ